MPHHQNTGQWLYIKTLAQSFENVAKLRYLGITVIDQNFGYKEIKSTHFRISCLLSKTVKIQICKYFICCFVCIT